MKSRNSFFLRCLCYLLFICLYKITIMCHLANIILLTSRSSYRVRVSMARILCIAFSVGILAQCSVNVPESKIPSVAWRPGNSCKVMRKIYIENDDKELWLTNPRLIGGGRVLNPSDMLRYNIVGVLLPGDLIRITRCFKYPGSTTGGTYLEGVIQHGSCEGEKVVWAESSFGNKYVTDESGLPFGTPDSDWFLRVNHSRREDE